jgi:hypothetical protein
MEGTGYRVPTLLFVALQCMFDGHLTLRVQERCTREQNTMRLTTTFSIVHPDRSKHLERHARCSRCHLQSCIRSVSQSCAVSAIPLKPNACTAMHKPSEAELDQAEAKLKSLSCAKAYDKPPTHTWQLPATSNMVGCPSRLAGRQIRRTLACACKLSKRGCMRSCFLACWRCCRHRLSR